MPSIPEIIRGRDLFLESDFNQRPQLIQEMDLCPVSQFFDEYVAGVSRISDEDSLHRLWREGHFRFSDDPRWLVTKSSRTALFQIWGSQLAVGANSFVL